MSARRPRARKRSGTRGLPASLTCGRCSRPLGFEGHSLTDTSFGRVDSCSTCWPILLDALAAEGLDLRAHADADHIRLTEATVSLAPLGGVN